MTEQQWLSCNNARRMLDFLQGKASVRKWRLVVCGYVRLLHDRDIIDAETEAALDASERFADGCATLEELQEARRKARANRTDVFSPVVTASDVKWAVGQMFGEGLTTDRAERTKVGVFRDLWGPLPFRPVLLDRNWLTPKVIEMAQGIYKNRTFDQMRDLARALEEAECDNADMLGHCRGRRP